MDETKIIAGKFGFTPAGAYIDGELPLTSVLTYLTDSKRHGARVKKRLLDDYSKIERLKKYCDDDAAVSDPGHEVTKDRLMHDISSIVFGWDKK